MAQPLNLPHARWLLLFSFFLTAPIPLSGDTVLLRDGTTYTNVKSRIEGNAMLIDEGRLRIPLNRIKSVQPGPVFPPGSNKNATSIDPSSNMNSLQHNPESDADVKNDLIRSNSNNQTLKILSGPLPIVSPWWFEQDYWLAAGAGGVEFTTLSLFILSSQTPYQKSVMDYTGQAAMLTFISSKVDAGSGSAQSNGLQQEISLIKNSLLLYLIDRATFSPVRDSLHPNQWISTEHYRLRQRQAGLFFLSALLLDSLPWFVWNACCTDRNDVQTMALSLQLRPDRAGIRNSFERGAEIRFAISFGF